MSTVAMPSEATPAPAGGELWRKSLAVSRMHLTDPMTLFAFPALLLGSIFAMTLVVWSLVPGDGGQGWGEMSVYFFLAGIAALAVTRSLPFSLGMGSSRRAFVLGTLLAEIVLATAWGLILFVMQRIEKASGGWGQHLHFFWWSWYTRSAWPAAVLFLVTSLAASWALGVLLAALWLRWNRLALLIGGPVAVLGLGGLAILATARHAWRTFGGWLGDRTPLDAAALCAAELIVLVALQYAVLRRVRG